VSGFIVIGVIGLLIVVLSLALDDLLEGVFEALSIDTGSGLFSAPVIGAFLAALGFGGALLMSAGDAGAPLAALGGLGAGVVMGGAAWWITRALMRMPTDEPVRTSDLVGKRAEVVTPIPSGGYGEVYVHHAGQRLKLHARAAAPVPAGTATVVIAVTSPSSVVVEPERTFWAPTEPGGSA
jgi:membrane protein implicated in regulation of membrane protease activity